MYDLIKTSSDGFPKPDRETDVKKSNEMSGETREKEKDL